jgi:hypothetical protein
MAHAFSNVKDTIIDIIVYPQFKVTKEAEEGMYRMPHQA